MGLTYQSWYVQLPYSCLKLSFSVYGSGTQIPVSKLCNYLGVQTGNKFSPSVQCTEAVNKVRRVIFMIRRSFQNLSKSAFIILYGALVHAHLEYGMPACSPNLVTDMNNLERIQGEATELVSGIRDLSYEERLQRRDLHSLQQPRLWADLITTF